MPKKDGKYGYKNRNWLNRSVGSRNWCAKNAILNKDSHIKITADRPRKFYYSIKTDEEEIEEIESKSKNKSIENTEHDLYKLLCQYLFEQDIFPKRINELTSSNKKGRNRNKWLHPYIVGVKTSLKIGQKKLKIT